MLSRVLLPIVLSAAVALPGMFYLGRAAAQREPGGNSSASEPITIDFGVLRQGESATHRIWLPNPGDSTLKIARFQSSCECVTVTSDSGTIAPGERALVTVCYDGTHDTAFAGKLGVTVQAENPYGKVIQTITAKVEVLASGAATTKRGGQSDVSQ